MNFNFHFRLKGSGALEKRWGPLFISQRFQDTKDPCPVYDGMIWHLYGSGGSIATEEWSILHATALTLYGPWKETDPVIFHGGEQNPHVAAPGVIYEHQEKQFHMFVQTDFLRAGGNVDHYTSRDGINFYFADSPVCSTQGTEEAVIYDPHPAEINGAKYLTYSGSAKVGRPDIYLLQSTTDTWNGPWEKKGKILSHHEVPHHNQLDDPDYEWGLEGSQLLQLPDGTFLLNTVCFLPKGKRGRRQRIFFAVSKNITGPYHSLGPIIPPLFLGWESGENGHATAMVRDNDLLLFYQARPRSFTPNVKRLSQNPIHKHWSYGLAIFNIEKLFS